MPVWTTGIRGCPARFDFSGGLRWRRKNPERVTRTRAASWRQATRPAPDRCRGGNRRLECRRRHEQRAARCGVRRARRRAAGRRRAGRPSSDGGKERTMCRRVKRLLFVTIVLALAYTTRTTTIKTLLSDHGKYDGKT